MTNLYRHVNSLCQLSKAVMELWRWGPLLGCFRNKSQVQNKRRFRFLNVFHCLLLSAWLNRARLHLDLFLGLWWFWFLVADVWPNSQQWTAAIDRVEEVPCFFRDLPRVSSCRVSARTHTHFNIASIYMAGFNLYIFTIRTKARSNNTMWH